MLEKINSPEDVKNLSINELINELEYAHSTKNFTLEQLVMNEYYQKQQ